MLLFKIIYFHMINNQINLDGTFCLPKHYQRCALILIFFLGAFIQSFRAWLNDRPIKNATESRHQTKKPNGKRNEKENPLCGWSTFDEVPKLHRTLTLPHSRISAWLICINQEILRNDRRWSKLCNVMENCTNLIKRIILFCERDNSPAGHRRG